MSLRDEFVQMANEVWAEADDVVIEGVYTRITIGAYSAATDDSNDVPTTVDVTVILEEWDQKLIDGDVVKAGDRIAKIRASELGLEPVTDDTVQLQSKKWKVMGYVTDPAGVVFDIHIRARK